MQILITIALILAFIAFIIYKVNKKFEIKEVVIFIAVVIITALTFTIYNKNQKTIIPNMFKTQYKKLYNNEILKLKSELLNNKNISSKTKFVYKFTYIIKKDNKEYLCSINNVLVKKIEDELVFQDFTNLKEECEIK